MDATSNAELITELYSAFAAHDHERMAACYRQDATFTDPVFTLRGDEVKAMWRMFCTQGTDLVVSYSDVEAGETSGSGRWEATYTFGATGRKVHNRIASSFRFQDGLIASHTDDFDFYRWSRMALGPVGVALGWTPLVRAKVRKQAAGQLRRFMAGEASAT